MNSEYFIVRVGGGNFWQVDLTTSREKMTTADFNRGTCEKKTEANKNAKIFLSISFSVWKSKQNSPARICPRSSAHAREVASICWLPVYSSPSRPSASPCYWRHNPTPDARGRWSRLLRELASLCRSCCRLAWWRSRWCNPSPKLATLSTPL